MRYHRGLLFWGLALITGGAVALAAQQGYIDRDWLAGAWRLWPLILVAIGLSILLRHTRGAIIGTIVVALVVGTAGGALIAVGPGTFSCGGADPTKLTTRQGTFGDSANVQLDFNCGTLKVGMSGNDQWTVASGQTGSATTQITADSGQLQVRSEGGSNWFNSGRQRWNVSLPTATAYRLSINPNAADTTVDLRGGHFTSVSVHPNAGSVALVVGDAQVNDLNLSLNAGSASISVGEGADLTGSLSVNAGSIELCTPNAVAITLTVKENITFSHNLDSSGLGRDGDTWSLVPPVPSGISLAFVNLHIEGNAGSFALNPVGGCS